MGVSRLISSWRATPARSRGPRVPATNGATSTSKPLPILAATIGNTDAFVAKQIAKARERGEVASEANPEALAQLATAALHTIAVRARAGISRQQLTALAASGELGTIHEVTSPDDNLQAVFEYLVKA